MLVSINGGTPPPIIHFSGLFPHKPTIFGYPPFMETPMWRVPSFSDTAWAGPRLEVDGKLNGRMVSPPVETASNERPRFSPHDQCVELLVDSLDHWVPKLMFSVDMATERGLG